MQKVILAKIFLFFSVLSLQAQIFVNMTAQGQSNGQSWADAYTNLHDALSESQSGDSIWVAEGIYLASEVGKQDTSFVLKSGVCLLGGFHGDETSVEQRDWQLYPSIFEGDLGVLGDSTDNTYTLLYSENPDSNTYIDGFTFRNASATGTGNTNGPNLNGGAIYVKAVNAGDAFINIGNCHFENNSAKLSGGAIMTTGTYLESVSPKFYNCTFVGNKASYRGGAVFKGGGSYQERSPDFANCTFLENTCTQRGGGLFVSNELGTDGVEITDCYFEKNQANISSAAHIEAGRQIGSKVLVSNTDFVKNTGGSSVLNLFNILYPIQRYEIANCKFIENVSFSSFSFATLNIGGSYSLDQKGYLTADKLVFEDNQGNIVFVEGLSQDITFKGLNILNNKTTSLNASNEDGKISLLDSYFYNNNNLNIYINLSGGIGSPNDTSEIIQCFFIKNTTTLPNIFETSSFYHNLISTNYIHNTLLSNSAQTTKGTLSNKNCIFTNFPNVLQSSEKKDSVRFTNCYMDSLSCDSFPSNVFCGAGNIFGLDPMFLDTATQDYHLHPCSPLINAGTNTPIIDLAIDTDLDGNPRILDGTVDIGPYESNHVLGQMSPPQITAACYGLAEGKVTLAAEGGCPPYALAWTRSDDGSMGSDTTGLLAGTYVFTLTDARGRQLEVPLQIGGSTPQVAIVGDSLACAFTPNAFLQANATNATQPIDFQWNTGESTGAISNLGAGLYSVEITDGFGCKDSASVEVTATPPVNASIQIINATGASKSDGALNFAVSSGYPPYSYAWSNGATTDSISNLLPGEYTVTVIDGNNCGYVFTYTVSFMVDTEVPTLPDATNTVWPNPLPAGAPLNIRFSTADLWHLMDAQGRVLCSVERTFSPFSSRTDAEAIGTGYMQTMQIELPCLASGTYFWSFSRAGRSVSAGKLVL